MGLSKLDRGRYSNFSTESPATPMIASSVDAGSKSKFGDCEADLVWGSVSDMCVALQQYHPHIRNSSGGSSRRSEPMKPNVRQQGKRQNQTKENVLNAPLKTRLRAPLSTVRQDSRQSGRSFAQPITQYAKSGDIRIAYQVFGEGPMNACSNPGSESCTASWLITRSPPILRLLFPALWRQAP